MCLFLTLTGCARKIPPQPGLPSGEALADLDRFPQDLQVYANQDHPEKRLLGPEEQEAFSRRFMDIYFGPWHMKRTSVKKRDVAVFFNKARGFKSDGSTWTQPEWDALADNADLRNYPARSQSAITLRETDLRELPTRGIRSDKNLPLKEYPFDYFQYALLAPGMPLLVAHATRDGKWFYVECPIASGWVDAADVALVTDEFKRDYATGRYAAIIREKTPVPGIGKKRSDGFASIGAVFPIAHGKSANTILVPVQARNGYADVAEISLSPESAVEQPLKMTPANVAKIGNQMMGQKYGWGGTLGERDCSAMTRDLFTPFGIWLPRNSVAQARRGIVYSLEGLSAAQKKEAIIREGTPFLSLLGMRGHIGLYVGVWHGEPAMFHNAWGVRIARNGDDNERYVIGKTVVTSIEPGKELKELYLPVTFTDRLRSLTTPRSDG